MSWLKKRSTAALVLILSAVLSIAVGGGGKLHKARGKAEDAFFQGTAGFSVYEDLMELRETGYNLLRISEAAATAEAEARAAAAAWAKLDEAKTPEALAAASAQLYEAVNELDSALVMDNPALEESWQRQTVSFYEYISHLRYDSYYDEQAAAYNELLRDPLTRLLGSVTGNGEMPRFTELF